MFDNLRDFSESESPFYEEEQNELYKEPEAVPTGEAPEKPRRRGKRFLGMTAQQRFLISLMLMFTVCLLGALVMFVLGRMSLF